MLTIHRHDSVPECPAPARAPYPLSAPVVHLLEGVAAGGGVVVRLVQQVVVAGVARLPQQILLVRALPEARVPQPLDVDVLHLPLQLLQAAGEVRAEALLHVVTDLQICCSPLDAVFMSRLQIVQWIANL